MIKDKVYQSRGNTQSVSFVLLLQLQTAEVQFVQRGMRGLCEINHRAKSGLSII